MSVLKDIADKKWCANCGLLLENGKEDDHKGHCTMYPIACTVCGLYVPRDCMEEHREEECSGTMVQCQFCDQMVKRLDAVHHQYVCPEALTPCDFEKYGCLLRGIKRKDLGRHLEEYRVQHMQMVEGSTCRLKEKVKVLEEKVSGMKQSMAETQQRMDHLEQAVDKIATLEELASDRIEDIDDTLQDTVCRVDEIECTLQEDQGDGESDSITF